MWNVSFFIVIIDFTDIWLLGNNGIEWGDNGGKKIIQILFDHRIKPAKLYNMGSKIFCTVL